MKNKELLQTGKKKITKSLKWKMGKEHERQVIKTEMWLFPTKVQKRQANRTTMNYFTPQFGIYVLSIQYWQWISKISIIWHCATYKSSFWEAVFAINIKSLKNINCDPILRMYPEK